MITFALQDDQDRVESVIINQIQSLLPTPPSHALAAERQARILALLQTQRAVRVDDLCTSLGVSPATARRDLGELSAQGRIRKVHGGAIPLAGHLAEPLFADKAMDASAAKLAIAKAARAMIEPNDCIYLDGGSTVLALAELLTDAQPLTVVTNSLRVAMALASAGPRLILVGGDLRKLSQTFVGPLTQPLIEQLHVDKTFMGTLGLSMEAGMTTTDPAEAFTKRLVMQRAAQVVLLADSTKFGKVAFAQVGPWKQIDTLITDAGLSREDERRIAKLGVTVIKTGTRTRKEK